MSVALHNPATIYSLRHAPSFVLLALSAGTVNALAFLDNERYVSHVTGTATRIGMDAQVLWQVVDYALVLLAFIAGAAAAGALLEGRHQRGKRPLHLLPLVAVSAILVGVGVAGQLGAFGPFGGSIEAGPDFVMLSLLSFGMGVQNATVALSTGLAVRTTHMTGPATDLGIHIATSVIARGEARTSALRGAALRGAKLVGFIVGALLALPLSRALGYAAFAVPAAIITGTAVLSFVPSLMAPRATPAPASAPTR